MKYQAYNVRNFRSIPAMSRVPEELRLAIEVVGQVLPFKTNQFVVDHLIDWDRVPDDPIFRLTFPQPEMLSAKHFAQIADALRAGSRPHEIAAKVDAIRLELNPHPAGQLTHNVPKLAEENLMGLQHKYRETVLFFPKQGQTCHAYCTFCFRWPQFIGKPEWKFGMSAVDRLVAYLRAHPEVTDLLITGGDPMVMSARHLKQYIDAILAADLPHLRHIRIGTKALSYWPYRFLNDSDADEVLAVFERVVQSGRHLALMAHFNHPREMEPEPVRAAIERIRSTGAIIRTQSPVLRHINDKADLWAEMWRKQVQLGCVPYYMFVERDTGPRDYFSLPLVRAWEIFRDAYQQVSGLARTVRGPSMSAFPGKVEVTGVAKIFGTKVFVLRFLQARSPEWVGKPFFARFDGQARWLDELEPAFGENCFFFETYKDDLPATPANSKEEKFASRFIPIKTAAPPRALRFAAAFRR